MSSTTAEPSTFIDTNVIVYLYDDDEPAKQTQARAILAPDGATGPTLSTQVLGETYVTLTRKLARPLPPDDALSVIDALGELSIIPIDHTLVRAAIATSIRHQLSYWDALIIETAASAGCTQLLTEDLAAGSTLRGVTIINPFATLET